MQDSRQTGPFKAKPANSDGAKGFTFSPFFLPTQNNNVNCGSFFQVKRWEEDDFYASDEDEFMDRTGDIGRKRKMRMKMAGKTDGHDTIETYDSLLAKHKQAEEDMTEAEAELKKAQQRKAAAEKRSASGDLDSYLSELKKGAQVDKETVTKLKVRIAELSKEKERLVKLINIARPAHMPELKASDTAPSKPKAGIMIGR